MKEKLVKVRKFNTDDEVCEFLSEQCKKYNLNIVLHWIVPYDDGYGDRGLKVFYQDYE